MKILERLKREGGYKNISVSPDGSVYTINTIQNKKVDANKALYDSILKISDQTDSVYMLSGERVKTLNNMSISIDAEVENFKSKVKKPYCKIRGNRVTEEQAIKLLQRTDEFMIDKAYDFVELHNFQNQLLHHNINIPLGKGWVHTDGTIGINTFVEDNIDIYNILLDAFSLAFWFKFLDMVIVITDKEYTEDTESLENAIIEIGIKITNGDIDIVNGDKAADLYEKYTSQYEADNKEIYNRDYYLESRTVPVSSKQVQQIISEYGLKLSDI